MTAARGQGGFVTPAFVAAVGMTLLLLVAAANVLAVHHARGVVQAAVEEGARQAVAAGVDACEARAADVIGLLGTMAGEVGPVHCTVEETGAVVTASATFSGWLPGLPAYPVEVVGRAATRPAAAAVEP